MTIISKNSTLLHAQVRGLTLILPLALGHAWSALKIKSVPVPLQLVRMLGRVNIVYDHWRQLIIVQLIGYEIEKKPVNVKSVRKDEDLIVSNRLV